MDNIDMDKIKRHEELCTHIHDIYKAKNLAYGDNFGKSFNDWGVASAAIRITDKFNRFINLAKNPEIDHGDEAITDTLLDLCNYSLMTVMEIERQRDIENDKAFVERGDF